MKNLTHTTIFFLKAGTTIIFIKMKGEATHYPVHCSVTYLFHSRSAFGFKLLNKFFALIADHFSLFSHWVHEMATFKVANLWLNEL